LCILLDNAFSRFLCIHLLMPVQLIAFKDLASEMTSCVLIGVLNSVYSLTPALDDIIVIIIVC